MVNDDYSMVGSWWFIIDGSWLVSEADWWLVNGSFLVGSWRVNGRCRGRVDDVSVYFGMAYLFMMLIEHFWRQHPTNLFGSLMLRGMDHPLSSSWQRCRERGRHAQMGALLNHPKQPFFIGGTNPNDLTVWSVYSGNTHSMIFSIWNWPKDASSPSSVTDCPNSLDAIGHRCHLVVQNVSIRD